MSDVDILSAVLDSWDRNNAILLNLLQVIPDGGLDARLMAGSPSVAEMFTHMNYVRLVFVSEDVPEFAIDLPDEEWMADSDRGRIAQSLIESAKVVREAVTSRLESRRGMNLHYDHPILLLQHMIWHDGYHHGQIKLALKATGCQISDDQAGPLTWDIWMNKK